MSRSTEAHRALPLSSPPRVAGARRSSPAAPPLIIGGAVVGGAMVATDRRTSGSQVDDEVIELKAKGRMGEALPDDRVRINTTSYNRMVLLTGEVPTEADKTTAEQVVARIDNVLSVVNELTVGPPNTFGRADQGRVHHHQGQGQPGRRQGPVRQLDQGRDAPRRRLPDGPRHRARGDARLRGRARRQRRRQGRPRVRDPDRGRARQHRAALRSAAARGERRPSGRRLIRLEVSSRRPPAACRSA